MVLAAANDQQQQTTPTKAAVPVSVPALQPPKESGLPWGWIGLGVVAYLAWGYWSLLKEQERRDARKRYG